MKDHSIFSLHYTQNISFFMQNEKQLFFLYVCVAPKRCHLVTFIYKTRLQITLIDNLKHGKEKIFIRFSFIPQTSLFYAC